jgi:hypothetical protein
MGVSGDRMTATLQYIVPSRVNPGVPVMDDDHIVVDIDTI